MNSLAAINSCDEHEVVEEGSSLRVLVVDDDATNRLVLKAYLVKDGYTVILANDGQEAVNLYQKNLPDLVLMDVMMPVMNGYEATRQIKQLAGDDFIPVIFLTAMTDEKDLAECIACGGDDFLTKPYNRTILTAKIDSMMRMKELHASISNKNTELTVHQQHQDKEHYIAEKIFAKMIRTGEADWPYVRHILSPMSFFNGDILLVAERPSGGVHVIVGDSTGHGLSAAIGTLPFSEIFYQMTKKGFSLGDIIGEINSKLYNFLPTGLFVSVCMMEINLNENIFSIWNGGLPDVILYDDEKKEVVARYPSNHLSLGIIDTPKIDIRSETLKLEASHRILVYSDGLIEASNKNDEMFGYDRLNQCIDSNTDPENLYDEILTSLENFKGGVSQNDDLTFLEVSCANIPVDQGESLELRDDVQKNIPGDWDVSFNLGAITLRKTDPRPLITQAIMECQALDSHKERIYTVISELFANSLDHGLLKLDSKLKSSAEGFAKYYQLREERLSKIDEGYICLSLKHTKSGEEGGRLIIKVEDSGDGFTVSEKSENNENIYSGRGIPLIRSICEKVEIKKSGCCVEVEYVWT